MIVERQKSELLVRLSSGIPTSRIQAILDYLRYEELTAKSVVTQEEVNNIVDNIKKGRWIKAKIQLGLND